MHEQATTPVPFGKLARWLGWALLVLILVALAGWSGGRWYLARSVAVYSGEVMVEGLDGPVEILFDGRGIPQVWALTDGDAFYALGWLHASERLFQMELQRRMAKGTLSEVLGADLYEMDAWQRKLGFYRKAVREAGELDEEMRALYARYLAGVNAWIDQAPVLPPEFVVLRFRPDPWTLEDALAVALYSTWFSHELMAYDGLYQRLNDRLGEEIRQLVHDHKPWSPTTVPDGPLASLFEADPFPLRAGKASNSWVVSPARSASGAALHASDPHLPTNSVPVLWYAAGLHSAEGLDAVGVSVPGVPTIHMGHNGRIAWSGTVSSVDVVDYYRERLHPEDSLRVATPEGWSPVEVVWEEIRVKGEREPRRLAVWTTPRGVVIQRSDTLATSLHWAGFDFSVADMVRSTRDLMRAGSFDEFRRAVTGLGALDHNWMYSDAAGNIGYQLGTPVPVRDYDSYVAQNAADPNVVWSGYRPLDETPHALNPAQGWLASTNNQIVPESWPYELPGFYEVDRFPRIAALLESKEVFNREDMEAFQLDRRSGAALRRKEIAAAGAERLGRADIAERLRAWDATMAEDDATAALFKTWWTEMTRHLFEDDLGDDWGMGDALTDEVVDREVASIIDDQRTPEVEDLAAISARAIESALALTRGRTLGEVQTLRIAHPLSVVRPVDALLRLSRGPIPIGGDGSTLNAVFANSDPEAGTFRALAGPSMRFVLDWADPDAFTLDLWLGQSGNPFSPHYDDFIEPMLRGERWVVPFSREAVEARAQSTLRLVPSR